MVEHLGYILGNVLTNLVNMSFHILRTRYVTLYLVKYLYFVFCKFL